MQSKVLRNEDAVEKSQSDENVDKRYRRRLAKALVLQAEVVCESHDIDPKRAHAALDRMLETVIALRKETELEQRREDFVRHLADCGYGQVYVERDDESVNLIVVEGSFDLKKLSKRMFWFKYEDVRQQGLEEKHQCL